MRLPGIKQFGEQYLKVWAQRVIARYEEDYTALAGNAGFGLAAKGATQADAQQLAATVNQVTAVAAGQGVVLPPWNGLAQPIVVQNFFSGVGPLNALAVYPGLSGQINALGANAPFTVNSGKIGVFWYVTNLQVVGGLLS